MESVLDGITLGIRELIRTLMAVAVATQDRIVDGLTPTSNF